MDKHDATEQAYKRGLEDGKQSVRKKFETTNKETLCTSCHIDVFIECPFVHGEGKFKGLKAIPVMIKKYKGFYKAWRVIECPRYRKETWRSIT